MKRLLRQVFRKKSFYITALAILVTLSGCKTSTTTPEAKIPKIEDAPISSAEAETSEPPVVPTPESLEETKESTIPALSAEPQRVEFKVEDGKKLVGHYFPAAVNPAPAVILMHWAGGDQRDWLAIAPWLQNRPDELAEFTGWETTIGADCEPQRIGPWLDPSWFPIMPSSVSFGVFIFDFRDFCESEPGLNQPREWALDAEAAFTTVSELSGVDPHQIVAIGASIGADGAPDGCLLHNEKSITCLGGFSLSPGSYLDMIYADVVKDLDDDLIPPEVPVWCLAAEGDAPSSSACRSVTGDHYQTFLYDGSDHGMFLLVPGLDPDPMVLIQDFLEETLGIEIN
jgi:hypothetical protein